MQRSLTLAVAGVLGTTAAQAQLFVDAFDSAASAANWNVVFSQSPATTAPPPNDYRATFGFDYSALATPIPAAPGGTGTRGLYLEVNKDAVGRSAGVSLYPVAPLSGNYKVSFDVWMNLGTGFTTEMVVAGVNHSGNLPLHFGSSASATSTGAFSPASDGVMFAMAGDGGIGTGTTIRDFSVFYGQGNSRALLQQPGTLSFDNADPIPAGIFPTPGNTGLPAGSWVRYEVEKNGTTLTWILNGTTVASFQNTSSQTDGTLMIGYFDPFASVSPAGNFAIIDNLTVVPEPAEYAAAMGGLLLAGALARRHWRR